MAQPKALGGFGMETAAEKTPQTLLCAIPRNTAEGKDAKGICSGLQSVFHVPKHRKVCMAREQAGLSGDRERRMMMMGSLGREAQLDPPSWEGTGWESREPRQHLPV